MNYSVFSMLLFFSSSFMILGLIFMVDSLSVFVSWELSLFSNFKVEFIFLLDWVSLGFGGAVLLIASVMMVYSKSYMESEKYFLRFHMILMSFVMSMIMLVYSTNLASLILGWDGLGVTSYLLVIYYQSNKSYNAGMITALSNRVGDVMIMVGISLSLHLGESNFSVTSSLLSSGWSSLTPILVIASFTKSAQIPFSAWLPAAMAAPTPVSALVHSSTLVIAGVYLMVRFFNSLKNNEITSSMILIGGVITMLMAGVSATQEMDMKKIVALSTLSQLGLMMTSLGMGQWKITFFHLITHAYMKALLFMSVGNAIHFSSDYQDMRKAKLMLGKFPISISLMLMSNLGLCGFPFLSGFYSKDMWLEYSMSSYLNWGVYVTYLLATALTVLYSFRFMYNLAIRKSQTLPVGTVVDKSLDSSVAMVFLWLAAMISGSALSSKLFSTPQYLLLPFELKEFIFSLVSLSLLAMSMFMIFKKEKLSGYYAKVSLWGLPFFSSSLLVYVTMKVASTLRKNTDLLTIFEESLFKWSVHYSVSNSALKYKSGLYFINLFTSFGLFLLSVWV